MRGPIGRDRHSRELEHVFGAEGTGRLGLTLERLLAGLDTLGIDRNTALGVIEAVAMDSVPPLRRRAYEWLLERKDGAAAFTATQNVAEAMGLPSNTVRRARTYITRSSAKWATDFY
jgi:hypothetical protein